MYCGRGNPGFGADEPSARRFLNESAAYVRRGYLVQDTVPGTLSENARALSLHVEGTLQLLLSGEFVGIVPDHIADPWVRRGELFRLPVPELTAARPLFCVTREGQGALPSRIADLMRDEIVAAFAATAS